MMVFQYSARLAMMSLILLAGIVNASFSGEEEPDIQWGKEVAGCRFGIVAQHESFRYDQPVILKMIVKNEREEDIYVPSGPYFGTYRFDVRLPNGKAAPLTLNGTRLVNDPVGNHSTRKGFFIGHLSLSSDVTAEDQQKNFIFEPAFRIDIGHVDWSPDGVKNQSSTTLGKKRYDDGSFKSLSAGLGVASEFVEDDDGHRTYRFSVDIQESDYPNVFQQYPAAAGVPRNDHLIYSGYYTVKLDDVIMLPHGYLYRVRLMEKKTVDLDDNLKEIPYVGVALQLIKDDDPLYNGLEINRKHIYIPFERGGRLFGFGLRFREGKIHPENSIERDAILCSVDPKAAVFQGKRIGTRNYEIEIVNSGNLPLYDVAFETVKTQLPDSEKNRQGWVQIDPHPIPLVTDIPRPAYEHDAPKEQQPARKPNAKPKAVPDKISRD